MYLNQHTVVGFLAADAEIIQISRSGDPLRFAINFRIGATKRFTSKGEARERTTWFSIKRYLSSEEGVEFYRQKLLQGAEVWVQGEHLVDEREGANGSKSRYAYIEATGIEVLREPRKKKDDVDRTESEPPFGEQFEDDGVAPHASSHQQARPAPQPRQYAGTQAAARQPASTPARASAPTSSAQSEYASFHDPANW